MTTPRDVVPDPESPVYSSQPRSREERDEARLFQEINERRARVENAELLANLRSL